MIMNTSFLNECKMTLKLVLIKVSHNSAAKKNYVSQSHDYSRFVTI